MPNSKHDVESLIRQLYQANRDQREQLLETLSGVIDRAECLSALGELLSASADDQILWANAAYAVAKIDSTAATALLTPFLSDDRPERRYHVAGLLGDYGTLAAVEPLMQALKNDLDADVRHLSAFSLGKLGDTRAIELLEWVQANDTGVDFDGHTISGTAGDAIERILTGRCCP
ncbi:MAG: hypothetical protein GC204_20300 [Chloroflexi bacterium]|nr:hypothetical protein [Chloroflexota bacterium]